MFYEKIKALANEKNLSINKIEEDCDISFGSICKWDKITPSVDKVQRVAEYLGITLDDLLEGVEIVKKGKAAK